MAKIQKSFRLSEEIVKFIEKQKGDTLNEKFENLIFVFTKAEQEQKGFL